MSSVRTLGKLGGDWPSIPLTPYKIEAGEVCPAWNCTERNGVCTWGSYAGMVDVYIDSVLVCTTSASSYNFNPAAYGGGKHTVVVRNATYGWLVGSAQFEVGSHLPDGVETNLAACVGDDHTPGYSDNPTNSPCICKKPAKQPIIRFGFDHAKVRTRNLNHPNEPAGDKLYQHCLGRVWNGGGIGLMSLVQEDALPYHDKVRWRINGSLQESSALMYRKKEPDDFKPHIYRVEIVSKEDNEVWDRLFVVVNNPQTEASYTTWVTRWSDAANRDWLKELPAAYKSLRAVEQGANVVFRDPEPNTTNLWEGISTPGDYYHHTSVYEMRSEETRGGHGHQACYDAQGQLVTTGVSAGRADRWHYTYIYSPNMSRSHIEEDAYLYIRACQLDGNPVLPDSVRYPSNLLQPLIFQGEHLNKYLYCRPPLPNNKILLEPGVRP